MTLFIIVKRWFSLTYISINKIASSVIHISFINTMILQRQCIIQIHHFINTTQINIRIRLTQLYLWNDRRQGIIQIHNLFNSSKIQTATFIVIVHLVSFFKEVFLVVVVFFFFTSSFTNGTIIHRFRATESGSVAYIVRIKIIFFFGISVAIMNVVAIFMVAAIHKCCHVGLLVTSTFILVIGLITTIIYLFLYGYGGW